MQSLYVCLELFIQIFILKNKLQGTDLVFCPLKNKSCLILRDTLLTENIHKASLKFCISCFVKILIFEAGNTSGYSGLFVM